MKLLTSARLGVAAALAAGVALGYAIVGTAAAAPAHPDSHLAAQAARTTVTVTRHFALAASAFAPDGIHDPTVDYFNTWDPAALSNQFAGRCFNTSLQLPTGITLKSVTEYYTAGDSVMFIDISRQDLVSHTATDLVTMDTTIPATPGYTSSTQAIAPGVALVDMKTYAYTAGVCPQGSTTFSGLVITYTQQVTR